MAGKIAAYWKQQAQEREANMEDENVEQSGHVEQPPPVENKWAHQDAEIYPFQCDVCGKRFSEARGLGGHKQKSHGIISNSPQSLRKRQYMRDYMARRRDKLTGVPMAESVQQPRKKPGRKPMFETVEETRAYRNAKAKEQRRRFFSDPENMSKKKAYMKAYRLRNKQMAQESGLPLNWKGRPYKRGPYKLPKREPKDKQPDNTPATRLTEALNGGTPQAVNFCPCCGYNLKPHNVAAHVAGEIR